MRTQEPTPFYIRTAEGETFYVESLEEALREFASEDGYRLSFYIDGELSVQIHRSDENVIPYLPKAEQYDATVTFYRRNYG